MSGFDHPVGLRQREVRIRMRDGVELAATLYLPGSTTSPCLLEALPYRKDDLTSSYTATYERLRDEYGYAVCRVDLRGTGSSDGDATDEYPAAEQSDLQQVIAWLAEQPWCDGNVGMFGTSYSGFNSLQLACERPPALKAVCAIYATDDRWTDDVHYRGGALKLVDLVDYCHYMTPMIALPPVPAVYGEGWRTEWRRRLETMEPWVLTWLRASMDGEYWRHGSVRLADGTGYERIEAAVMLVAGWADGYRNNSFRTIAAFEQAGVPYRLLAGPWAHADPETAMPGPRIDLTKEMAAFFDAWLRDGEGQTDRADVFVRESTRPAPDLDLHEGFWTDDVSSTPATRTLEGPCTLTVEPDVGTAAWIDCAGHLPWGQSGDQRVDDARSLVWEWPAEELAVMGMPAVRLRLSTDVPIAALSVKLNDVFPDGTSALVTRGSRCLRLRADVHGDQALLEPDEVYDVDLELDACAYRFAPGHTLRVSIAGSDWPNTVAPPAPVTLTIHDGELTLPTWDGAPTDPGFTPGAETTSEDPTGTTWAITDDVLNRTTTCHVDHGSDYETPYDGHAWEHYAGTVSVDRRTFEQRADADCTFRLTWPGVDVSVHSTMQVELGPEWIEVTIDLEAYDGEELVTRRDWTERLPR